MRRRPAYMTPGTMACFSSCGGIPGTEGGDALTPGTSCALLTLVSALQCTWTNGALCCLCGTAGRLTAQDGLIRHPCGGGRYGLRCWAPLAGTWLERHIVRSVLAVGLAWLSLATRRFWQRGPGTTATRRPAGCDTDADDGRGPCR